MSAASLPLRIAPPDPRLRPCRCHPSLSKSDEEHGRTKRGEAAPHFFVRHLRKRTSGKCEQVRWFAVSSVCMAWLASGCFSPELSGACSVSCDLGCPQGWTCSSNDYCVPPDYSGVCASTAGGTGAGGTVASSSGGAGTSTAGGAGGASAETGGSASAHGGQPSGGQPTTRGRRTAAVEAPRARYSLRHWESVQR